MTDAQTAQNIATTRSKRDRKEVVQNVEEQGYFKPSGHGESFCIMIPPPNVTGSLHMGHGFNNAIMDALTRYNRMMGKTRCGNRVQTMLVLQLKWLLSVNLAQGVTRHDLGREKFIEKVWEWKEQSGGTITKQIRRLGSSVDWSRERFTMDEGLSNAVKEVFRLHEDGLIYRGKRLVNWDPKLQTALSDLEVESKEEKARFGTLNISFEDKSVKTQNGKDYLVVATTRPETLLGDTAVAVHPEDERYAHLVGKNIVLPITGRLIPIVADDYVEKDFGTGCVKLPLLMTSMTMI